MENKSTWEKYSAAASSAYDFVTEKMYSAGDSRFLRAVPCGKTAQEGNTSDRQHGHQRRTAEADKPLALRVTFHVMERDNLLEINHRSSTS